MQKHDCNVHIGDLFLFHGQILRVKSIDICLKILLGNIGICDLRAQSFTSLKADLRQDINGGFAFSRSLIMEHFREGGALLRLWKFNSEEKICICYSSHLN